MVSPITIKIKKVDWHSIFEYQDGHLYWKISTRNTNIGDRVGSPDGDGYIMFGYDNKVYKMHRVIFEMFNPDEDISDLFIDHKDRDRSNNRIENLRSVSPLQNSMNRKGWANSGIGLKGVSFDPKGGKYVAQIIYNKVRHRLGRFETAEEAKAAYDRKAFELHGEYFCS